MNLHTIFLILCSIGAIQSLFIGGYFLTIQKGRLLSNKILGFLLLAIAIRVGKSTLWLYYSEVSQAILNMGFAAHLAIVPLLMLYVMSFRTGFTWKWHYYLHLLPALAILLSLTVLTTDNFWYRGGYSALLYHSLIYLVASLYFLLQMIFRHAMPDRAVRVWLATLYGSIALFCMAYFLNYEMGMTSYVTGPVVYSAIIYFISFYVLRNYSFFTDSSRSKYQNIQLGSSEVSDYTARVKSVVEEGRCYLEPDFTLTNLSEKTRIPKHLLSNLFNVHLNQSFTDYTNQFRINQAVQLMNDPSYDNIKISAIAFECGFNTLSAFNAAFKKHTRSTPSEYRKKIAEDIQVK